MSRTYRNVSTALPELLGGLLTEGTTRESRNGSMREILMANVTLERPYERYITTPGRKALLPAQIAETMWVLAGRNDIEFLTNYLPRAVDFSDDGYTWKAGYGPRLRSWKSGRPANADEAQEGFQFMYFNTDQLSEVVRLLNEDQNTRRAVMTIFDPTVDYAESKDVPCNNWISFIARDGKLHAQVAIRSNDIMWGWSGINAFEWSALLEIVAGLTGLSTGSLTFATTSLHLYSNHYTKADRIVNAPEVTPRIGQEDSRFNPSAANHTVAGLDSLIDKWFRIEHIIRTEPRGSAWKYIQAFPEPMMRDWLYVLYGWHNDNMESVLGEADLLGSSLAVAALQSPRHPQALLREREAALKAHPSSASAPLVAPEPVEVSWGVNDTFADAVGRLHAEKHAAYGDSWKRRGEMIAIMANCARKVDRLGVDGAGDTSADTAIDLLVYLVKYRLWLTDNADAPRPDALELTNTPLSDDPWYVQSMLNHFQAKSFASGYAGQKDSELIDGIKLRFEQLEGHAEAKHADRFRLVDGLIRITYPLAYRLWIAENQPEPTPGHAERNAKRRFNGYADTGE